MFISYITGSLIGFLKVSTKIALPIGIALASVGFVFDAQPLKVQEIGFSSDFVSAISMFLFSYSLSYVGSYDLIGERRKAISTILISILLLMVSVESSMSNIEKNYKKTMDAKRL